MHILEAGTAALHIAFPFYTFGKLEPQFCTFCTELSLYQWRQSLYTLFAQFHAKRQNYLWTFVEAEVKQGYQQELKVSQNSGSQAEFSGQDGKHTVLVLDYHIQQNNISCDGFDSISFIFPTEN